MSASTTNAKSLAQPLGAAEFSLDTRMDDTMKQNSFLQK